MSEIITNILVCGTGGQGVMTAAEILAQTQYPARGCVIIDFSLPGMNGCNWPSPCANAAWRCRSS